MKNKLVGKLLVLAASAVMVFSFAACDSKNSADQADNTAQTEEAAEAEPNLDALEGTYSNLFYAFSEEKYNDLWADALLKYCDVAADKQAAVKDAFLGMFKTDVYGEEAEKLAAEDPNYYLFNCAMTQGVVELKIDGNTISGVDKDGKELFSHEYTFYKTMKQDLGRMGEAYADQLSEEDWPIFDIYVCEDANDEFKYFAFAGDTPAETFHIEFRYGDDADALCKLVEGKYGYWMASGIYKDCDEEMMKNCINLFVSENAENVKAIAESM